MLLDALGAEEAYCQGCDLCLARRAEKDGRKIKRQLTDFEQALKLIRKYRGFYTIEEIESELEAFFNEESVKKIGMRIWTHSDLSEILSQLLESGKIRKGRILWKDRLYVSPCQEKQRRLHLPLLHPLQGRAQVREPGQP